MSCAGKNKNRNHAALALLVGFYLYTFALIAFAVYLALAMKVLIAPFLILAAILFLSLMPRFEKFVPPGIAISPQSHGKIIDLIQKESSKVSKRSFVSIRWVEFPGVYIVNENGSFLFRPKSHLLLGVTTALVLNKRQFRALVRDELYYHANQNSSMDAVQSYMEVLANRLNRWYLGIPRILASPYLTFSARVLQNLKEESFAEADFETKEIYGAELLREAILKSEVESLLFFYYYHEIVASVFAAGYVPPVVEGFQSFFMSELVQKRVHELVKDSYENAAQEKLSLKERSLLNNPFDDYQKRAARLTRSGLSVKDIPVEVGAPAQELLGLDSAEEVYDSLLRRNLHIPAIEWSHVAQKVILPAWEAMVKESGLHREPISIYEIFNLVFDAKYDFHIFNRQPDAPEKMLVYERIHFWGLYFGVVLWRGGWRGFFMPGSVLVMKKEKKEIRPEDVFEKIAAGEMGRRDWAWLCEENGIDDLCYREPVAETGDV